MSWVSKILEETVVLIIICSHLHLHTLRSPYFEVLDCHINDNWESPLLPPPLIIIWISDFCEIYLLNFLFEIFCGDKNFYNNVFILLLPLPPIIVWIRQVVAVQVLISPAWVGGDWWPLPWPQAPDLSGVQQRSRRLSQPTNHSL